MPAIAFNKIMLGDIPIIDLTSDTVSADMLLSGITAHRSDGEIITGTIARNETISDTISNAADSVLILSGYYAGAGSVSIDSAEQSKIIPSNIKSGVSILGVIGTMNAISLTKLTPNGTDITHYWMPKSSSNLYFTISYEDKTNTRSDEYIVEAGKSYLARFLPPYGAWCSAALSKSSLINNTSNIGGCSMLATIKHYGDIFFTAAANGYLILYKDDTATDGFQTECYKIGE